MDADDIGLELSAVPRHRKCVTTHQQHIGVHTSRDDHNIAADQSASMEVKFSPAQASGDSVEVQGRAQSSSSSGMY